MSSFELLTEAIANHGVVLLSTGAQRGGRLSACLEGEVDGPEHAFRATIIKGELQILDALVVQSRPVEVSFNTASARVFFDSIPLKRERGWFKQRVLLKWPERLTVVERRSGEREPVPDDMPLVAVLSEPSANAGFQASLFDISRSGAALLCQRDRNSLGEPVAGKTYSVLLTCEELECRFIARCRNVQRLSSNSLRVGIEFEGEKDFDAPSFARFQQMLENMESMRIRRAFRSTLTKTVSFVRC